MRSPLVLALLLLAPALLHAAAPTAADQRSLAASGGSPAAPFGRPYNVTFDHRSMIVGGHRELLLAGSIHYPRSTPEMWPQLLRRLKEANMNTVDTYVFWNLHEPVRGEYDFHTGRKNLPLFLKLAQEMGLYVNLRIGPYVCAEWNYGGFPEWLRDIPGMEMRTYNYPFMLEMEKFVRKTVDVIKPFLANQGGPIILLQIENEYGNIQGPNGDAGQRYIEWCSTMANGIETSQGVPWLMCQQPSYVPNVLKACNGFYCDQWLAGHFAQGLNQPGMWTENWPGWFYTWGEPKPSRPTEDVAFAVARFIAFGGTYHAYYMFHGGTNFDRTSGGPFITTSYDYDAPLDEYGLPHPVKYHHLAELHSVLARYRDAILSSGPASYKPISLGYQVEAHVYEGDGKQPGLVFLSNINANKIVTATWNKREYSLPRWSVTIIRSDNGEVLHCTATVLKRLPARRWEPVVTGGGSSAAKELLSGATFLSIAEPIPAEASELPIAADSPLEQLIVTKDTTDFMWSVTDFSLPASVAVSAATIDFESVSDYISVFVDGKFVRSVRSSGDSRVSIPLPADLQPGTHRLQLLDETQGLFGYGNFFEQYKRGVLGEVSVAGVSITHNQWHIRAGLEGEIHNYPASLADRSDNRAKWGAYLGAKATFVWHAIDFALPLAFVPKGPLALDLQSMGRGFVYVNGQNLGRYWSTAIASGSCNPECDYAGAFGDNKCRYDCGQPSQRYFHVPLSALRLGRTNRIVFWEEQGGDLASVRMVYRV